MPFIYFENEEGKRVSVEVTEEVAAAYRKSLRAEWRNEAEAKYHTTSLDRIMDAGHDFADMTHNAEQILIASEDRTSHEQQMVMLREAVAQLTLLQQETVHKIFILHMTQAEVAREEGVLESVISHRVTAIYKRLRKLLKKN